jgi:hypothetical protein
VLGDAEGSSTHATSWSTVAELLEGWIDTATADRVYWGSHSALVVTISHFPELDADLEVIGSGRSVGLIGDEVDALRSQVRTAADSLESHITSSVACNPPDGAGE